MEDFLRKLPDSPHQLKNEISAEPYWLDRLVDGELSDAEQQRIVSTLDQIPDGWKKCALGFLEAQIWRKSLEGLELRPMGPSSAIAELPPAHPSAAAPSAKTEQHTILRMPWTGWLSLAATVTFAFLIGHSVQFQGRNSDGVNLADTSPRASLKDPPISRSGRDGSNGQTQFITNNNFWDGGPAIPSDVSQILKNYGARMERRSGFFRAKTVDGQSVLIPYEDIELVPAKGGSSY